MKPVIALCITERMIELVKVAEGLGSPTVGEVAAVAKADSSNIYKYLNGAVILGLMKKTTSYRNIRFTPIAGWNEVAIAQGQQPKAQFRFGRVNSVFDMGDRARAENFDARSRQVA